MNPQNDFQSGLKNWGPIKAPLDKASIELWGNITPEFVIEMHKLLGEKSIITELPILKPRNKKQRR